MSRVPDLTRVNGFDYKRGELVLSPNSPMESAKRLLIDRYTRDGLPILYRHRGTFYCWQESHYREITTEYLRADVNLFLDCAQRHEMDRDSKKTKTVPFNPKQTHVTEIVGSLNALTFLGDILQPPFWLGDAPVDIDASEILACENGLLHLPTRSLMKHTPTFFTHNDIGYAYDPAAPQPTAWFEFLRALWGDDHEAIQTLKEIFGYCLVADTTQQKAFILVGPKRSGKGTIARILQAVVGHHNVVAPTISGFSTNFGMAPLIGKRLAIISDARIGHKTDTNALAERLLAITGEDTITLDRKNRDAWTGKLDTRFILISNELPRIADASGALPSRFVILVLQNSFFGQEDHGLTYRLLAERSGILNWAIEGYDDLCARGYFVQPESGKEAVRELEELASPVSAFVRDICVIGAGQTVDVDHLFFKWQDWCESQNRDAVGTKQTFGKKLREAFPAIKQTQPRDDAGVRYRAYEGIGLAPV